MTTDSIPLATRWEQACAVLMALALALTLAGTLPFIPLLNGSGERGFGGVMFALIWLFGIAGLTLCSIENAPGKKIMAMIGFGWSIIALLWNTSVNQCPLNEECLVDTSGQGWLLTIAIVLYGALLYYNTKRDQLQPRSKKVFKVVTVPLLVLWTGALIYGAATFHKPHALRIAPSASIAAPAV